MNLFARTELHYNRSESLEEAARAIGRGNRKRAIMEYRKVLLQEPDNPAVLGKTAALLAETGRQHEAAEMFVAAAEHYRKKGFDEKALATYVRASRWFAHDVEIWESISLMYLRLRRPGDAVKALLDGHRHFLAKPQRPTAFALVVRAREIQPWHHGAVFALAKLLAREKRRTEASDLLESLSARCDALRQATVRRALFFLRPTPVNAWRWLRAIFNYGVANGPRPPRGKRSLFPAQVHALGACLFAVQRDVASLTSTSVARLRLTRGSRLLRQDGDLRRMR